MGTERKKPQAGEPFDPKRHGFEAIGLVCALPPHRWGLNDLSKLLYLRLILLSLQTGKTYPSEAYLARTLARSERRIREAIGRLRRAGLIETHRRGPHSMEYTMLWPPAHQPDERPAESIRSMARKTGRIRPVISKRADKSDRSNGEKTGRIRPKDRTTSSKRPDGIVRQNEQGIVNKGNERLQQQQQPSRNETLPDAVAAAGAREAAKRMLTELIPDLLPRQLDELLSSLAAERLVGLAQWSCQKAQAGQIMNPAGLLLAEARRGTEPPAEYLHRGKIALKQKQAELQWYRAGASAANFGDGEAEALWAKLRSALAHTHPALRDYLATVRVVGVDGGELILAAPPGLREALFKAGIHQIAAQAGVAGVVLFATEETEPVEAERGR